MKKIIIILSLLLLSNAVSAGYAGGYIKRVYTTSSGWTYVGLTVQPSETCSSWGEHFKFDSNTVGGKNMLATLLSAKMGSKLINVWYSASIAIDTDQYSGCDSNTISTLTAVGIP